MTTILEKTLKHPTGAKTTSNEPAMVVALEKLLEEMAVNNLKSGQALKESVLAKQYGLSRNAVREALNQIVGWGLFEYIPYRGYYIKKFTIYNLLQWDELREALEPIAARRLAKNRPPKVLKLLKKYCEDMEKAYADVDRLALGIADYKFHLCVVEHCGNDCFSQLQTISNLAAGLYFGKSILDANKHTYNFPEFKYDIENFDNKEGFQQKFADTLASHREMSKAIFSGDAELAEELFRAHAHRQVEGVERYIDIVTKSK